MAKGSIVQRGNNYYIVYRWNGKQIWKAAGADKKIAEIMLRSAMGAVNRNRPQRQRPKYGFPVELITIGDQILEFEVPMSWPPCIYFLLDGLEVIYVGQSINLLSRIVGHRRDKKEFDRILYLPVAQADLNKIEQSWIRKLKPRLNKTHAELTLA